MSNNIRKTVDDINGAITGFAAAYNGYAMTLDSRLVSANELLYGLRQVTSRDEATAALKDVLQAIMDTADKQGWPITKRLAAASLATY